MAKYNSRNKSSYKKNSQAKLNSRKKGGKPCTCRYTKNGAAGFIGSNWATKNGLVNIRVFPNSKGENAGREFRSDKGNRYIKGTATVEFKQSGRERTYPALILVDGKNMIEATIPEFGGGFLLRPKTGYCGRRKIYKKNG